MKQKNTDNFYKERYKGLLNRLIKEDTCLSSVEQTMLICESRASYYELRRFLEYMVRRCTNSTTKTVINELIKVLGRMEFTNVRVPMTAGRIALSQPMLRKQK